MSGTKFVIFIDSFGDDDLEKTSWIRANLQTGTMDTRPVFVTPTVLGQVYTGESPAQNGLPAVSRYDQQARGRPNGLTLPEMAGASDQFDTVIQAGLPFIVPPDVNASGTYWHQSGAMGQGVCAPEEAQQFIATPSPPGEIDKPDENMNLAYDARMDHTFQAFAAMRNAAIQTEADVVFFSYRLLDSYCHYQYDEPEPDDTYRDRLLREVDRQVKYTADLGDVFVFGDHGARDLTAVFRLNRWLIDHGYLAVDIDHRWRSKAEEYGVLDPDDSVPGEQFTASAPGVAVDEEASVAIGDDPFSTGITLLDGADVNSIRSLVDDLESEDAIEKVHVTDEMWSGDLLDECPDLYAERAPGVFVSGNMAPEKGGVELTRSGVHHPIAAYGSTGGVPESTSPTGLFDVIAEFIGLDEDSVDAEASGEADANLDDDDVREHLADLGYL